jgi:hypothetical protein
MRKVTHYINEKFEEHSDPIADMGIGTLATLKPGTILMCKKPIAPRVNFGPGAHGRFVIEPGQWVVIKTIEIKKSSIKKTKMEMEIGTYDKNPVHMKKADIQFIGGEYLTLFPEKFFDHFDVLPTKVNEKFIEDSDAIQDMGIGMLNLIRKFMHEEVEEITNEGDEDTDNLDILLAYCVAYTKEDFVDYLLSKGANINSIYVNGWFKYACKGGYDDVVSLLIRKGFNIHGSPGEGHEKGLRIAIANDHLHIVKLLIAAGADPEAVDGKPVRIAIANNHMNIIKYLKSIGVKLGTWEYFKVADKAKIRAMTDFIGQELKAEKKKRIRRFFGLKESLYEKFEEESDPVKDMGIGMDHYIYNIGGFLSDSYTFDTNPEKAERFIKKCIPEISKNELKRFMSFTMSEIYDNIDGEWFELNNLDKLDKQVEAAIKQESRHWMSLHSDESMAAFG